MPLHKYNNPGLVYYKALSKYLEMAREIPEVTEVRLTDDDTLYTIISASRNGNETRYRVFDAQGKTIRAMEEYPFDFRLLDDQAPGH